MERNSIRKEKTTVKVKIGLVEYARNKIYSENDFELK
jgi:hypothetical protein